MRVLENPPAVPRNVILIDIDVWYYLDPKAPSPVKKVNSLLRLEVQEGSNKVLSHKEEWVQNESTTSDLEEGIVDWMAEQRKRAAASVVDVVNGGHPKN